MKKIIVTGCNGQLGRAINLELKGNSDIEFVNTDVEELDITNIDKVMELAREVKPYAIINCAAHTGVDACEDEWDKAYRINAIGPRNLSIAATETGAIWYDKVSGREYGSGFCQQILYTPHCMAVWGWQEFCKDYAAFIGNQ